MIPLTSATPDPCRSCGTTQVDDGFCPVCGMERRPRPRTTARSGRSAALSDRGPSRPRNEDAYAIHEVGGVTALVVCDGVGGCPRGDAASRAAADAAIGVLGASIEDYPALDAGTAVEVLVAATGRAQAAVAALADRHDQDRPPAAGSGSVHSRGGLRQPATTFVAALVIGDSVAVAHVGDSRAYWLADGAGSRCLTTDHSALVRSARHRQGTGGGRRLVLSCWLGADAASPTPDVTTFRATGSGHLLLCSDGLWHPLSSAEHLSALVVPTDPAATALALADAALAAGTSDNVTVALAPVPAVSGADPRAPRTPGGSP